MGSYFDFRHFILRPKSSEHAVGPSTRRCVLDRLWRRPACYAGDCRQRDRGDPGSTDRNETRSACAPWAALAAYGEWGVLARLDGRDARPSATQLGESLHPKLE